MDRPSPKQIVAGAAQCDISPTRPVFLYGYPFVERTSTGIHDPLLASALYLSDGTTRTLFIANDVIFIPKALADRARRRIAETTGISADNVMVTATHTHSGPVTTRMLSNESDAVVPEPDAQYLQQLEDGIVSAARSAYRNTRPASVGLAVADGSGLGGNRHDPNGVRDPRVPVLAVRSAQDDSYIGLMVVCSMHPTVLHEDSTVVSGDFPGLTRVHLQQHAVGPGCPVIYHMGAAGNQSPRHVTRSNTLDEARRLGDVLGGSIAGVLPTIQYQQQMEIDCRQASLDLPLRSFPPVAKAEADLDKTRERLKHLRETHAPKTQVRSAECDWFGAEETATLARAADSDRLKKAAAACMPARVQVIRVGPWSFIGWPGEVFVEFALEVKERFADSFVITLANGDLEGYLVTQEAIDQAAYESGNAVFKSPDSGRMLVEATADLLQRLDG
jgi:Neutral/alkaline non-lysosomal ceramidase, N-terminal